MTLSRFAVLLLLLATSAASLYCYDSGMKEQHCHALQPWCVKWRNSSTMSRGCADVNVCAAEVEGCFPTHGSKAEERWCCCNRDFCNSSSTVVHSLFAYLIVVIVLLLL
ncbi:hypothetical protein GCK32_008901 [Trichostrongylus colubriformis]|uniref:Uncharacterized protein n=1 Tax=Trichostrongylus colubriformis TaxID=6319 RepID=A0AAN8FIF5_TRICO